MKLSDCAGESCDAHEESDAEFCREKEKKKPKKDDIKQRSAPSTAALPSEASDLLRPSFVFTR